MSNLEVIEARLRRQLEQLEKQRGEIEKKLRALEVVKSAAEEIEAGDGGGSVSGAQALADFPAQTSAAPSDTHSSESLAEAKAPEAPQPEPPKQEPPQKEPPKEEPPKQAQEEEELIDTAERNRRDLEASVVGVTLNPEDAVLEVLRVFKQPLKATKVAEELMAVNFPLDGDPKDVVKASLENLEREGLVKKSASLRGVFYTLAEG